MTDKDYLRGRRELWEPAGGPNGMSRRRFLQAIGLGTGAALAAPSILQRLEAFAAPIGATDGILVLVMLGGGNDGLNTLVPFTDAKYKALRPTLAFNAPNSSSRASLSINDPSFGVHPNLPKLANRYKAGQVAFVRGVGYNPSDMSHFNAMGYWMQGWKDAPPASYANGWAGRYLDTLPGAGSDALLGVCIGASVPLHMIGATARAAGLPLSISGAFGIDRSKPYDARLFDAYTSYADAASGKGQWADLYTKTAQTTMGLAQTVQPAYVGTSGDDDLVAQLTLTGNLINLNLGTRVFHTSLASFDTHGQQEEVHNALLRNLDDGIDALFSALDPTMRPKVTLLTFSEFGRRAQENTGGTDHGAAGVDIVVGDKVKGGLYGTQPSLTDLDQNGNLKANVDFRAVYAEMLGTWLGADPAPILGQDYPRLGLFSGTLSSSSTSSTSSTTSTTTAPAVTTTTAPPASTRSTSTTSTTVPTTSTGTLPRRHRIRRRRSR